MSSPRRLAELEGWEVRALDLFCGAGGASMGLHRAGFEVVGVDIEPQPHYPFGDYPFRDRFVQADALEAINRAVARSSFDFIWASPPCQSFTAYKRRKDHVRPRENLIPVVRESLRGSGIPYVIENVPGGST